MHDLALRLSIFLARAHELKPDASLARLAGLASWNGAAPFVLASMLAGAAVVLVQTRFLLSGRALRMDFSRVSPRAGLKRLLGPESLVEAGKSLAKIAVLAIVLWRVLLADLPELLRCTIRRAKPASRPRRGSSAARGTRRAGRTGRACRAGRLLGVPASLAVAAHESARHSGRAEGDRGRSSGEGAGEADPYLPCAQAHAGGGTQGDGGDHQSNSLRHRACLRSGKACRAARGGKRRSIHSRPEFARWPRRTACQWWPIRRWHGRCFAWSWMPISQPSTYQAVAEIIAYVWRLARPAERRHETSAIEP